jgi:hypothetical protein
VHEGGTRLHVKEDYSLSANFSENISRSTKQIPGKGTKIPGLISLQKSIEILNQARTQIKSFVQLSTRNCRGLLASHA